MTESLATTELVRSTAEVRTPKAAGYLAQLCKHFAHKIPASYEGNEGRVSFPRGECRLTAEGDMLTLTVETGDPAALEPLQDVVARHLLRFAFREELAIAWRPRDRRGRWGKILLRADDEAVELVADLELAGEAAERGGAGPPAPARHSSRTIL